MMTEQEPKYFTNFRKEINEKFEKLDVNLGKKFGEINERLDSHEEQIIHVSEQVTMLSKNVEKVQSDVNIIKGDIVLIKEELRWKVDKDDRPASLVWL